MTRRTVRRWFKSTSNRTFIVFPLALAAIEAAWQGGWPTLDWRAVILLPWGYLQYRLSGNYRNRIGGGGPGIEVPPERLVATGIYALTRNPMYLGHLIFMLGLALALHSWVGAALLVFHLGWFNERAKEDEARLVELFGDAYCVYAAHTKRWVPWVL